MRQLRENKSLKLRIEASEAAGDELGLGEILARSGRVFARHILGSPLRAINELRATSSSEIHQALKQIHSLEIGISIIHCADDNVFPMDEFQKAAKTFVKSDDIPPEGVDGVYTVRGNHNEILYNSEAYARVIEEVLTALDKKNHLG